MSTALSNIWPDKDVVIVGGGPSIKGFDMDLLKSLSGQKLFRTIGVNKAYKLGSWIDCLWFGDGSFLNLFQKQIAEFPNIRASCCPQAGKYNHIYTFNRDRKHGHGITKKPGFVSWNKHSGGSAINLAYHFGASRVFLLGFDMDVQQEGDIGLTHWHEGYPEKNKKIRKNRARKAQIPPFNRHMGPYPQIAKDANQYGMKVYNVVGSPDSRINVFDKITFDEMIKALKDKEYSPELQSSAKGGKAVVKHVEKNSSKPEVTSMRKRTRANKGSVVSPIAFLKRQRKKNNKRWHWLSEEINKRGLQVGAEIGVAQGKNILFITQACPTLKKIYAVDPWGEVSANPEYAYREHADEYDWFQSMIKQFRLKNKVEEIRLESSDAAVVFEDRSLDFVFIDAGHKYDSVSEDINLWRSKVRQGGLLCGHDLQDKHPGVKQALDELLPGYKDAGKDSCWYWEVPNELPTEEEAMEIV